MVDGLEVTQTFRLSSYLRTRRNAAFVVAGALAGMALLLSLILAL